MNIPNLLTLLRILIIPVLVIIFYLPFKNAHTIVAVLFAVAALTDWLDGFLARNLHQGTPFGSFLDPVADKLIVAVALVLLVGEMAGAYMAVPAAIIVGREIVISGLREWMAEIGKRTHVAVSWIGKVKTAAQMSALILLLLYKPEDMMVIKVLGLILLYVSVILTLWSMILYLKAAWSDLTLSVNQQ